MILRPNETLEIWYGHKLTKEEASEISGIPTVIYLDQLDAMLQAWMHHAEHVYLDTNENDRLDTTLPRLDLMYVHQLMKRYPLHKYERAAILLKELRAIKTKNEVAVMQQAVDITHKALMRYVSLSRQAYLNMKLKQKLPTNFYEIVLHVMPMDASLQVATAHVFCIM